MCAVFFLWPKEGGRLVGGWNDYIGLVFLTFFVQYAVRTLSLNLGDYATVLRYDSTSYTIHMIGEVVVYLGSIFNNLLLLAAARILLNKPRSAQIVQPTPGTGKLNHAWLNAVLALPAVLPKWVLIMVPLSLIALLEELFDPWFLWARLPDALFSVYCIGWFGYSLALSFFVRRRKVLAVMAFCIVLSYGAGQLVYAANPVIAYMVASRIEPAFPPVHWTINRLRINVAAFAAQQPERGDSQGAEGRRRRAAAALDNAIFAVLFPMKYLLFLPTFALYLLSLISVNDFREALRQTTSKRKDYLSKDGILSVIGKSLDADEVKLLVRIPGIRRRYEIKEERVLAEIWSGHDVAAGQKASRLYPTKDDPLLFRVLHTEGKVIVVTDGDDGEEAEALRKTGATPQTLALIPIKFHGGVIGALRVIFRGYGKYNTGTLEQLKFMSELIAPSVQDFRTVSAVDKLGPRLNRWPGNKPTDSFKNVTDKMVRTQYDLLNPLAVGLIIEFGFTSLKPVFPEEGIYHELLEKQVVSYEQGKPMVVNTVHGRVRIERDQLSLSAETGRFNLGNLVLAIPDDKDDFAKPTLAAYYLTRRMVASLTGIGIFNAARNSLGVVIQDLGVALNREALSLEEWFEVIGTATKKSGLLWVVAAVGEGKPWLGRQEHFDVLTLLTDEEKEVLSSKRLSCIVHSLPESGSHHIIQLELDRPEHRLWLGVQRERFGPELNFQSPWKDFLDKLAKVAGAALVSIEERQQTEEKWHQEEAARLKAAQDEFLHTIAVFSAMLMHQLVNMVKNQLDTAEDLLEIVGKDPLAANSQFVTSLIEIKESAKMMQALTHACDDLTKMEDRCCSLKEAAQQAAKLFQFGLTKKRVKLDIKTDPDWIVQVPSKVVVLALASLIGNAFDATRSNSRIVISARKTDVILCDVINNGPAIREDIRARLFTPGSTGKNGHSGWGLYLVSRSLERYGGEVFLSYSTPDQTCFTLRLPTSIN
jgi:signal transduction histidine kinase